MQLSMTGGHGNGAAFPGAWVSRNASDARAQCLKFRKMHSVIYYIVVHAINE